MVITPRRFIFIVSLLITPMLFGAGAAGGGAAADGSVGDGGSTPSTTPDFLSPGVSRGLTPPIEPNCQGNGDKNLDIFQEISFEKALRLGLELEAACFQEVLRKDLDFFGFKNSPIAFLTLAKALQVYGNSGGDLNKRIVEDEDVKIVPVTRDGLTRFYIEKPIEKFFNEAYGPFLKGCRYPLSPVVRDIFESALNNHGYGSVQQDLGTMKSKNETLYLMWSGKYKKFTDLVDKCIKVVREALRA